MKGICTLATAALAAVLCAGAALAQVQADPGIVIHKPKGLAGTGAPPAGTTGVQTPPIGFHGGAVMNAPKVYLIWYGNWNQSNGSDTPAGQAIVYDLLHGLSGSPYYMTNASYTNVSGTFTIAGTAVDSYSQGTALTDNKVASVVSNAISTGKLPKDSNGIYFVLSSTDVSESSGFCTQYCGWHTYTFVSGTPIKYAFVGNANRCLNACAAQSIGPNGNAGVDGMASVISHELEESNTDPYLTAWYDAQGNEDADKCAWTFGQNQHQASNGAFYNMTLPGIFATSRNFLIQRELDANSLCYVNYVTKAQ